MLGDRPADQAPGVAVDHGREVEVPTVEGQVGETSEFHRPDTGRSHLGPPKTRKSRRRVTLEAEGDKPLTPHLLAALTALGPLGADLAGAVAGQHGR